MRFFLALLVLVSAASMGAASANELPTPAPLIPGESFGSLKPHIVYVTNAPRSELREISSDIIVNLQEMEHASIQFGQVGQSVVALIPVKNSGSAEGTWVFNTGRGTLTSFRLYIDRGDGLEKLFDNSDPTEVKRVLRHFQAFATNFELGPREEALFVIQFSDTASSYMPLKIRTSEDFFSERRTNVALVSGVLAGSLILVFFNVLMFAVTGKPEFIWLGAAEVAFTLSTIHAEGYTTIFLFYDKLGWQAYFGDIIRTAFALLMVQFGRVFLEAKTNFPVLDRTILTFQSLGVTIVVLAFFAVFLPSIPGMPIHIGGWIYLAATAIALPLLAWKAISQKGWSYWPLLVSWSSMGGYIVYMAFAVSGIAPQLPLPWHWAGPIGLFECLMATLALGFHLRQIQKDRLASEADAKEALLAKLAISNEATRLAEDRARALAALQSKDRVIEASGHDTRHVLHALNSAIHYTRSQGADKIPAKNLTSLIEASARHLDEIVATSVSVGGDAEPFMALGIVDLRRVIADIEAIYSIPAQDSLMKLRLRTSDVEQVITDEALVARALSNLVNNAIKFSQNGVVTISCSNSHSCFVVSVEDEGPGMPSNVLRALSGESKIEGNGPLGTGWRAIREIVDLLGGDFRITTNAKGTRVALIIPDPLAGAEPAHSDIAQFAQNAPDIEIYDGDELERDEIEDRLKHTNSGSVPILVTGDSSSSERMWAATCFPVVLFKPLCLPMLDHPHLRRLQKRP